MINYQHVYFNEKTLLKEINTALNTKFKKINKQFKFLSVVHSLKFRTKIILSGVIPSEVANILKTIFSDLYGLSIIDKKYDKVYIVKGIRVIEQNPEWYDLVIEFIISNNFEEMGSGLLKYTIQYNTTDNEIKINLTNVSQNIIIDYINFSRFITSIIVEEYRENIEFITEYIGIFDEEFKYKSINKKYLPSELIFACKMPIKDLILFKEE
ncbi:MAG: hypothetical protein QXW35_00725 [Candidatus Aenigmatarchaeota archaeon]